MGFSGISKSDWDRIFGDSKDSNEKLANARVKTGERRGGDRNPGRQSGSIKLTWPSASLPNYEGARLS